MKPKVIFNKAKNLLNSYIIQELHDQGHYLTGALDRSITSTSVVTERANETNLTGFALEYAKDLEEGKTPSQIGDLNTHIKNLMVFFLKRGLPINKAVAAAIRTANKHKIEGIPTEKSKRFSKTGERKHFISRAWKENEQKIDSLIDLGMDSMFNEEFNKQKSETI